MNKLLPEAFQPWVGLTDVALADESPSSRLPADSRLQPIDAAVEAQLRIMLRADTFDALILEAVRPSAFDRGVLAPARFHQLREAVSARLAARRLVAASPEETAELAAAAAVLRTRTNEHELGEALRYALLKG